MLGSEVFFFYSILVAISNYCMYVPAWKCRSSNPLHNRYHHKGIFFERPLFFIRVRQCLIIHTNQAFTKPPFSISLESRKIMTSSKTEKPRRNTSVMIMDYKLKWKFVYTIFLETKRVKY